MSRCTREGSLSLLVGLLLPSGHDWRGLQADKTAENVRTMRTAGMTGRCHLRVARRAYITCCLAVHDMKLPFSHFHP
jgi:hypothetical protein